MQKIIIITGKANSGKTQQAKALASVFKDEEVVFINMCGKESKENPYLFNYCRMFTKMVVLDEIPSLNYLKKIISNSWSVVHVNPRGEIPFQIDPVLVFVCHESITEENLVPDIFIRKIPSRVVVLKCN